MIITTEEAERLASVWCGKRLPTIAAALRALAAERDALKAERNAERSARFKVEAEFSHMQRRIARQRRALAKLYRKRHDRKAERDHLEKTAMRAAQRHEAAMARADKLQAENARLWEMLSKTTKILVAAFNRIHGLPRTTDTELSTEIEKCLGEIRRVRGETQ
jgi:chromosome segregation ATPase